MTKKSGGFLDLSLRAVLILIFSLSFFSLDAARAAGQTYKAEKKVEEKKPSTEADVDAQLGVLSGKKTVKSAAEKEAERLEAQAKKDTGLEEANRKLMEEERKRIERSVIEDKLSGQ